MKNLQRQFLSLYRRNQASIFIFALWVLTFFSILVLGLGRIVFSQINLLRSVEQRSIGQYLAKSASIYVRLERKQDEDTYDSLYKLREEKEKLLGRGRYIYTLIDEESKININKVSSVVLGRLPGLDTDLVKEILQSPFRPFKVKEEILLVDGMNQEAYDKFKDLISIYSSGKVNINTAPLEILVALGLSESLSAAIVDFRKGSDGKEATEDDEVFETVSDIIDKLRFAKGLSVSEEQSLLQLISAGVFITRSENFTIDIKTMIAAKEGMHYNIVIDKDDIKEWREY